MEKDLEDKKTDKKKQPSKKGETTVNNSIELNPTLNEAAGKTVVLGWGRMNPITSGHEKLANKIKDVAKKRGATPQIYLGHSNDPKKNPLSYDDKVMLAKIAFGSKLVVKSSAKTIFQVMKELEKKFDNLVLVVGADRIKEFDTLLNKYNGKDYTFDSIEVVSAGERTDPDSDEAKKMTADTMSASVMRKLASEGDFETFKKGLPKKLQSRAQDVYDMVRGGMKLSEMYEMGELDEILNLQQRRKKALTMRKYKTKIAMARKRMRRRLATTDKLKQRARKKAISTIRKKVAGKQGVNYKDLNPAQKMIIDKKVAKRKPVIDRIAKRLLPQVKKADRAKFMTKKEEYETHVDSMVTHEVQAPKRKRFHQMHTKEGMIKIDGRFKAFKQKKSQFEEVENDIELLNLIEQVSKEISEETLDEVTYNGSVMKSKDTDVVGNDPWGTKKLASFTWKKGKYSKAVSLLNDIITRKKKENKGKLPHTVGYYASTVAKQIPGIDTRTLMKMVGEEAGAGEEGTDKLTKRYKKDTPFADIVKEDLMSEGPNMEKAKERIKRLRDQHKQEIDDIEDNARRSDTALKNRQTEEFKLSEDKGSPKHHLGIGSNFKHMLKHATKHVDYDMDGDVDDDDFKKTVPDEITGAEKKDLTKQMYKKFKHEKQHTRKGVAFEQFFKEEVTQRQIQDLEKFADRLLQKFDIDVEFTRHFADRMNDERNKPAISIPELQRLFKKIHKEKGKNIRQNPDTEVVLKDIQSDLNLPVVINYDRNKDEFEVVNKTIMRKKDFKTSNKVVRYESTEPNVSEEKPMELIEATYMVTIEPGTYGGMKSDGKPIIVKAKSTRDATTKAAKKVKIDPRLVPAGGFKVKVNEEVELGEAKGTGVKKFVKGMRVAKLHNPDMKGTVIKGGDNMKKSVEVEWDSGKTTLASGKYLMSISKNESVDLEEWEKETEGTLVSEKLSDDDWVHINRVGSFNNPKKDSIVGYSKAGKNINRAPKLKSGANHAMRVSVAKEKGYVIKESVELGEAKISVGDRVTLKPNKNTLDQSLIGKAGVVTGMLGSKPTVKFANGKTIAVSPKDLTINEAVELDELKVDTPDKKDSLGIPRHKMPQVAGKDYDELLSYLTKQGLKMQKKKVKANTLKPTQSNFNTDKIVKSIVKMKTMKDAKPIIVSSDNHVIDGHHRWLAAKNTGESVDILQVDAPAKQLIRHVSKFPKTFTRGIND